MRTDAREVGRWLRWALVACLVLTAGCSIPTPYSVIKKAVRGTPPEARYEPVRTPPGPLP